MNISAVFFSPDHRHSPDDLLFGFWVTRFYWMFVFLGNLYPDRRPAFLFLVEVGPIVLIKISPSALESRLTPASFVA